MDTDCWRKIERIFEAVLEAPESEREALVTEMCAGDAELEGKVQAMLAASGEDARLEIEGWIQRTGHDAEGPMGLESGAGIGPYRLVEVLGEGGMGVVWLADQTEPLRRQVALKVIKLGMDTASIVARFESERQTLAMMTHANIAQVFDGGVTSQGRPYFVMERVQGEDLNRYCDKRQLTARQRIELFLEVCRGVQHAHLKGVIHRDLKPKNVLVDASSEPGTPKIIDFGIAKAIGGDLVDRTTQTRAGHALGTPAYMSPEQADGNPVDVDTRSDIYSLGVMLYELLVGALPADAETIAELAARSSLGELNVPRPSRRLSSLSETTEEIARNRRTTPETLIRTLAGDLDWIILKAMEKEPARRYSTVDALAKDLQRFLAHEPVEARPPTVSYQLQKFVRRHRVAVIAAGLVLVAVLAGAGLATYGMVRARAAETAARQEAATARRIKDFMVGIFSVNDPYNEARGGQVTARELLDRGAEQVEQELSGEPALQADVMSAIGNAYLALGAYEAAEPLIVSSWEEMRGRLDAADQELALALGDVAELRHMQGRFDEAVEHYERSLELLEQDPASSDETKALVLGRLCRLHTTTASYERAREFGERALAINRTRNVPRQVAISLRELGILAVYQGRYDDAMVLYREAEELAASTIAPDNPLTLDIRESMALAMQELGEKEEAVALQREVLAARERVLGQDHPTVAFSYHNVGRTLASMGRFAEAIPLYERSIEIREAALGADHPNVGHSLQSLAIASAMTGDLVAAEGQFLRSMQIYELRHGPDHPETLEALQNLAILSVMQDDVQLALTRLERVVDRGYIDLDTLTAPPLDGLAGNPRYDALLERARQ